MPNNDQLIRDFYEVAEKNIPRLVSFFTEDGYFYNVSEGVKSYGKDITTATLQVATGFPDLHRQILDMYVIGDVISVELSLNGTHMGPLQLATGTIPATGRKIQTPCSDVFHLKDGKVKSFHCYTAATIMLTQLGVFGTSDANAKVAA